MAVERGEIHAMLDLVLKGCGVWTRGDFAAIINDNDGLESFVDECRRAVAHAVVPPACIDASLQTETATATVGTTMDSFVNVREVGSMATFSLSTGARMVSSEVQCKPRMVQHAVQATQAARDASTSAVVSTENASTSHYLVLGLGLAHGSSQTEPSQPELPRPESPRQRGVRCGWSEPRRLKHEWSEPVLEPNQPQAELPPEPWVPPPPVFANCSHYGTCPRSPT